MISVLSYVLRYILEILLFLITLWCINSISILFHEMGHAIAYVIATKDNNWLIQIGKGKTIFKFKKFIIKATPVGGYFQELNNNVFDSKNKEIAMLVCGPLFSLILLMLLIALKLNINIVETNVIAVDTIFYLINYSIAFNLLSLILSIIPSHFKILGLDDYASDGLLILTLMRGSSQSTK